MSTPHQILWIDDEYEQLRDVRNDARNAGLTLVPFRSLESGMEELEKNYTSYEAVLLDARFYERESDVAKTEDTKNAFAAQQRIHQLVAKKAFQIFVLTGQSGDSTVIDKSFEKSFGRYYRKGVADDVEQLWKDIRSAAEEQPTVQLRRKYARAFAVCDHQYVDPKLEPILLSLLEAQEGPGLTVDHLNVIRKIVEMLGRAIVDYGFVPSTLDTINNISRVLRGDATSLNSRDRSMPSYRLERGSFPVEVGWLLSSLVNTTQSGSHPLYLDAHLREVESNYWVQASFFQLLALLEWFKSYVDSGKRPRFSSR